MSLDEGQFLLERIAWAFDDPNADTTVFDDVQEFIHKEGDESEPVRPAVYTIALDTDYMFIIRPSSSR